MHFFQKLYVFALLLLFHSFVHADSLNSPAEAKNMADRVMAKVGSGEIEAGLRLVKPFLIIPSAEFEAIIEKLKLQLPVMSQRFGKSIGAEFIKEEKVGENLFRLTYIHRFERHPMRWVFYFYRGKSGWMLDTFKTDDDLYLLF